MGPLSCGFAVSNTKARIMSSPAGLSRMSSRPSIALATFPGRLQRAPSGGSDVDVVGRLGYRCLSWIHNSVVCSVEVVSLIDVVEEAGVGGGPTE